MLKGAGICDWNVWSKYYKVWFLLKILKSNWKLMKVWQTIRILISLKLE